MSSTECNVLPVRIAASSRFGVTREASGNKSFSSTLIAAGFSNCIPLVDTITGSTTSKVRRRCLKN